ncbi:hypothetical protein [Campylobacter sp.]|uniref:hypothetical protein n=1 Tax=Campylobacter sp. TaxID=205 RepID=UPI002A5C8B01|nr:hypothetical protein [Campylobacter sp.]MDD7703736.1 hypothetical protein [Campylobacteraceae bacterium]MDY2636299.1 hypothetical protein [Campylobacter sp.]
MIFLLLLPFFIFIFVVLLPAVWSLAIYGALRLRGCEAFGLLIAVVVGASGLYAVGDFTPEIIYAFYLGGFIIGTPIYLLIFRSRLRYINETKAKKLLIFGSIATLFIIWELEVPQQVIFNNLTKHSTARYMYDIEIVDDNYTLPVDYKRFSIGHSKDFHECTQNIFKCPILPYPIKNKYKVYNGKDKNRTLISNVYVPFYGKSLFLYGLSHLKSGGSPDLYESIYIEEENIYKKLEILKFKQQKG